MMKEDLVVLASRNLLGHSRFWIRPQTVCTTRVSERPQSVSYLPGVDMWILMIIPESGDVLDFYRVGGKSEECRDEQVVLYAEICIPRWEDGEEILFDVGNEVFPFYPGWIKNTSSFLECIYRFYQRRRLTIETIDPVAFQKIYKYITHGATNDDVPELEELWDFLFPGMSMTGFSLQMTMRGFCSQDIVPYIWTRNGQVYQEFIERGDWIASPHTVHPMIAIRSRRNGSDYDIVAIWSLSSRRMILVHYLYCDRDDTTRLRDRYRHYRYAGADEKGYRIVASIDIREQVQNVVNRFVSTKDLLYPVIEQSSTIPDIRPRAPDHRPSVFPGVESLLSSVKDNRHLARSSCSAPSVFLTLRGIETLIDTDMYNWEYTSSFVDDIVEYEVDILYGLFLDRLVK